MAQAHVRIAIVGAGETGCGWAALAVAAGWPVALYDHESRALSAAEVAVAQRARALVQLGHADEHAVERGMAALVPGRSLLKACADAEWIIEAIPEDLLAKQKLFEALEGAAPNARAVTSSASTLSVTDITARCRRPDRCLVAHPQSPPELIPLVEILPSPKMDAGLLELVKGWLRALGRIPVTVRKPVQGHVADRIAAAVWREAIALVLDGVMDVDDLDRAVSLGPGLSLAAAGPHLGNRLQVGGRNAAAFMQQRLQDAEALWTELAAWPRLEPEQRQRLLGAIERAYAGSIDEIAEARNRRLTAMLRALEDAREA